MQVKKTLRRPENRFEKFDLVICDEPGFISFDKDVTAKGVAPECLHAAGSKANAAKKLEYNLNNF